MSGLSFLIFGIKNLCIEYPTALNFCLNERYRYDSVDMENEEQSSLIVASEHEQPHYLQSKSSVNNNNNEDGEDSRFTQPMIKTPSCSIDPNNNTNNNDNSAFKDIVTSQHELHHQNSSNNNNNKPSHRPTAHSNSYKELYRLKWKNLGNRLDFMIKISAGVCLIIVMIWMFSKVNYGHY